MLELRLIFVMATAFLLPGYALLHISPILSAWHGLQKFALACGLSLALYVVGFYILSLLPAFVTIGPYHVGAFLVLCGLFLLWQRLFGPASPVLPSTRPSQSERWLEWIGIAALVVTLFTRWIIAYDQPYPAWSDSLHHTILTQLIATQGRLPATLEPYFSIPLAMYHLGLHGLAAVVMGLAQVPAHTALLWTAQTLNGLCGLGVYALLDRQVGRVAAISGAVMVGLISYQPAHYVNWGRFTQVASQALLPIAWLVIDETLARWAQPLTTNSQRGQRYWLTFFAGLLTAALFLLHFRVAAIYLLLIGPTIVAHCWAAWRQGRMMAVLQGACAMGLLALLLVAPALWAALDTYWRLHHAEIPTALASAEQIQESLATYYIFSWATFSLAGPSWFLLCGLGAALIGLLRRNRLAWIVALWTGLLFALGHTYLLGIAVLNVTNLGAILIMLYLPIGLATGIALQELVNLAPQARRNALAWVSVIGICLLGLWHVPARIQDIEEPRFFVTPADVAAMDWIRTNTPPDAKFAINATFWTPALPHGTDGGYWIPYFTGRSTTTTAMLLSLADFSYQIQILAQARAVARLESDLTALDDLSQQGVTHLYLGARSFSGPGLNVQLLATSDKIKQVYQQDGVTIYQLMPPIQ